MREYDQLEKEYQKLKKIKNSYEKDQKLENLVKKIRSNEA